MDNSLQYEERVYETSEGVRGYRFRGRDAHSGYPENLECRSDGAIGAFVPCMDEVVACRIQSETLCNGIRHHWSRLTAQTWHCKNCGIVIPAGEIPA